MGKNVIITKRSLCRYKWLPYLLLFVVLILMHCLTDKSADDLRYMRHATEQTLFEFVRFRYFHWSSRFIIDSTIMAFAVQNVWVWRIVDSFLLTMLPYLIVTMFSDGKLYAHIIACFSILLFPFWMVLSGLPIAGSVTCLWPIALFLLTFLPLKNKLNGWGVLGCLLVLCFCANSEQMCCVLLGLIVLKSLYLYNVIGKTPTIYVYLYLVVCLFFFVFAITCPGNIERTQFEVSANFPTFPSLSIIDKLSIGMTSTFKKLFAMDVTFSFLVLSLVFASLVKQKVRLLSVAVLIVSEIYGLYLIFSSDYPISHVVLGSSVNPILWSSEFILLLIISALVLFSLLWCVWVLFDKKLPPFVVVCAGFLSRMIMSFSPTIFASGYRTMSIFYFTMIFVIILSWDKIISKNLTISKVFMSMLVCATLLNTLFYVFLRTY